MTSTTVNSNRRLQTIHIPKLDLRACEHDQRLKSLCENTWLLRQEYLTSDFSDAFHEKVAKWASEAKVLLSQDNRFEIGIVKPLESLLEYNLSTLFEQEAKLQARYYPLTESNQYSFFDKPLSSLINDTSGYLKLMEKMISTYQTTLGSIHIILPYIIDPSGSFELIEPNSLNELAESMNHYWHTAPLLLPSGWIEKRSANSAVALDGYDVAGIDEEDKQ